MLCVVRLPAPAPTFLAAIALIILCLLPDTAAAWGDEGHSIIALIADRFLDPAAREKVAAMLSADPGNLTAHDIASEATWADRYRDADRDGLREQYLRTRQWHFVNIELGNPDLGAACFDHPKLPAGVPASKGPAQACIVDKIEQFAGELADPNTGSDERLLALKFLLHLVGDVHQPLHAADDHDAGGNGKQVTASGFPPGNLHHFWDTEFVERLGIDPAEVTARLIVSISAEQQSAWSHGMAADWAMEAFALARDHAYGLLLAPVADGVYQLTPAYIEAATRDAALQLSKAGVRLAAVLNNALGEAQPPR
jgi:hypothetical protein